MFQLLVKCLLHVAHKAYHPSFRKNIEIWCVVIVNYKWKCLPCSHSDPELTLTNVLFDVNVHWLGHSRDFFAGFSFQSAVCSYFDSNMGCPVCLEQCWLTPARLVSSHCLLCFWKVWGLGIKLCKPSNHLASISCISLPSLICHVTVKFPSVTLFPEREWPVLED